MAFLVFSESESRRFAYQIYRAHGLTAAAADAFLAECAEKKADIVILRENIEAAEEIAGALRGRCEVIWADNLIEFRKVLRPDTVADQLGSGARIIEAGAGEKTAVLQLVPRCYANYRNHYHANPQLNTSGVTEGLGDFSAGFISRENCAVLLAFHGDEPCGYLCLEIRDGVGSTVIGGSALDIAPGLRHKVLCDLTHAGDLWFLARGVKRFRATTRIDKTYIQKLLFHNMHCLPAQTLSTLHFNLFLGGRT